MFEIEKMDIDPENEAEAKEIINNHKAEIEVLLADADKILGEGRTADVRTLASNDKVCIKIYKKPEDIIGADFYLPPSREMYFLSRMKKVKTQNVRVPKVYGCYENGSNGPSFIMMEKLNAVSIDDIVEGRALPPSGIDMGLFRDSMYEFVEEMHRSGIYHRDLHTGNAMIDINGKTFYVIDFGASNEFIGDPEPGERGPYHITKDGEDIILKSDEAMVKTITRELMANLTK